MAGRALLETSTVFPYTDWTQCRSTYDAAFVSDLKREIDASFRSWEAQTKSWLVHPAYAAELLTLLAHHQYTITDHRTVAPPPPSPATIPADVPAVYAPLPPVMPQDLLQAFAVLRVWWDAPLDICEAAYKAWARVMHPDVGGAPADMQRINTAITTIRKHLKGP